MATRKCYSKCRKLPETDCGQPECKFVNGRIRHYCRLSHQYKMDENCVPQLRPPRKTRKNKKEQSQGPNNDALVAVAKQRRAPHIIKRFMMRQDPNKRRARFLNTICSDAGVCIAFGKESDKINKHFGGFLESKYMKPPIKRIGKVSANGFVNEIAYENQGYTANAILKSSANTSADNLLFEYIVGKFLNEKTYFCPCFVETYAWLLYKDETAWNHTKTTQNNSANIFVDALDIQKTHVKPSDLATACADSKHVALLTQHIKNAKTITGQMKPAFCKNELLYALYQLYMPLSMLVNFFTHYDLHQGNVLLYEPVHGAYIEYNYHLADGTVVSFCSSYVVKIIDYGRCFFVDPEVPASNIAHSSANIYNAVCKTRECDPDCGEDFGFRWATPGLDAADYFISSSTRNMSHDLRFIYTLLLDHRSTIKTHHPELSKVLERIVYGHGIRKAAYKQYGTKEQTVSKLPRQIVNVIDMHTVLKDLIMTPKMVQENRAHFATKTKLGTLNIYTDGREMEYVQSTRTIPEPKAVTPPPASPSWDSSVDYF